MTTNGTHPPPVLREPTDPPDQRDLPDSWAPLLDDPRWLDEQYNLGTFEAYRGEHVAAVNLAVVGHGRDLTELVERVAREFAVPPGRVATVYVDAPSSRSEPCPAFAFARWRRVGFRTSGYWFDPGLRFRSRRTDCESNWSPPPPDDDPDDPPPASLDQVRRIDAIVDTGAPLTSLGSGRCRPFATNTRWLDQPPTPTGRPRQLTVLGGRWTYRLARVLPVWWLEDDTP